MKTKHLYLLLTILVSMAVTSQNLKDYQWKNRIILIIANDIESEIFKNQIKEFKLKKQRLKERKLIIYRILPTRYKIENTEDKSWINDSKLYETYNSEHQKFKVLLIGLDSGIKIEKQEKLTTEELFKTIDAMPMRRAEIRTNEN